jgi:hypothetical protein
MALDQFVGEYRALSPEQRDACLDLTFPRFLELAHPTPDDFGRFFGVVPGTADYAARRAAILAQVRAINIANTVGAATISLVTTRARDGRLVALAAQQIIRGSGALPLACAVGDPAATLPMHRMLRGYRYPRTPWLDPERVTEAQIGEFTRLVVADRETIDGLVATGALGQGEARALTAHAMYAVLASAFWHDQSVAPAAVAYITNTRPRLTRVLARLDMHWQGLYEDGAEPTARMLDPQGFNYPYWHWAPILRQYVPDAVAARGVAASIAHLARHRRELLALQPFSLPHILPNDAATRAALRRWRERYALERPAGRVAS